jgi:predicted acyl esterase
MVADGDPVIADTVLPPGAQRVNGRLIIDKTPYEAQALTWTSTVLARPAEITGYPRLVLWAQVSRPDADFIAELTDVAPGPDGGWTSTQITRGYLRARAQFSATGPTDLDPGDVNRIRCPAIDVSWHGPGLGEHPFSVTVHTGPDAASYAEIPVIGDDPAL